MIYLDIILKILGILSLLTFMVIIIWGFVVFNSIYSQLRYSNYILEKISHILNISCVDMQVKAKEKGKEDLANVQQMPSQSSDNIKINETVINEPITNSSDINPEIC